MRSRRRLWWCVLGTCIVLAIGVGFLARPEDELAWVAAYHPKVDIVANPGGTLTTSYGFGVLPVVIAAELSRYRPVHHGMFPAWQSFELPSGRKAIIVEQIDLRVRGESKDPVSGVLTATEDPPRWVKCRLNVEEPLIPWYAIAWNNLKRRFGLQ